MIEIKELHHVSLSVTDLERSKHFYGNVLGLTELERPDFDFPGAWYSLGQQQLHLIVYSESKTLRKVSNLDTKDGHFAIRVKDYYKTISFLKRKEVQIIENPYSTSGFAQVFCKDPDDNLIELNVDQKDFKSET